MRLGAIVLDSDDSESLADFYQRLLGWENYSNDGEYVYLSCDEKSLPLIFQEDKDYRKPAWPTCHEQQQQMIHLDFYTDDLDNEVNHAIRCGAELAKTQYSDYWRVLIDPAGHPFCIVRNS